ncbi:MAG: hypothetical protein J6S85_16985 [Methanobrevibacter sp.]|nr:hypothetical protein [Methanobrevibacter sp.]
MRLIDADALIEELDSVIICENFDAERMIRDMPTVCDIEQMIIDIAQIDDKNGWIPIDEVFDIILKYIKEGSKNDK